MISMLELAPGICIAISIAILWILAAGSKQQTSYRRTSVVMIGTLVALGITWFLLQDPRFIIGIYDPEERFFSDRWALSCDIGVFIALLSCSLLAFSKQNLLSTAQFSLLLMASLSLFVANHSDDIFLTAIALILASVSGLAFQGKKIAHAWTKQHTIIMVMFLLGVVLIYGATSTTSLHQLHKDSGSLLLRWGARSVEKANLTLEQSAEVLNDAMIGQLRDTAIAATAPVALFIPGMLLLVAGFLANLFLVPLQIQTASAAHRDASKVALLFATAFGFVSLTTLVRILCVAFHPLSLVIAPYGWSSAMVLAASISLIVGSIVMLRQRTFLGVIAWGTIVQYGMLLFTLVAAASFYAHANLRFGGMRHLEHYQWGQWAGDRGIAAILYFLWSHGLSCVGLYAGLTWIFANVQSHHDAWAHVRGLGRSHPLTAIAFLLCAGAFVGFPLTAGFFSRVFVFRSVLEHNSSILQAAAAIAIVGCTSCFFLVYMRLIFILFERSQVNYKFSIRVGTGDWLLLLCSTLASLVFVVRSPVIYHHALVMAASVSIPAGDPSRNVRIKALNDGKAE